MTNHNIVEKILALACWTSCGDDTQAWRFEIIDDRLARFTEPTPLK